MLFAEFCNAKDKHHNSMVVIPLYNYKKLQINSC